MAAPSIRLIATSKAPAATGYSARQQPDAVRERPDRDDIMKDGCGAGWSASRGEAGDDQHRGDSDVRRLVLQARYQLQHHVTNMNDFQDVNETFKNFFTADTYPARSFFQVVKLPKNALVMIDAVAVVAGQ
ncbi:hypothetical protein niasHT_035344 [Heterodera trifolii]|uniref:Uncharacterized protein n=1 Tax=Heterodera trifolii TaxID=157864 RepID=A0ABD2IIG3_9BILA